MNVFKYKSVAEALILALSVTYYWVEIIDPSQAGRAVVERHHFYTRRKAENYKKRQLKFDFWNKYEIIPYKT